LTSRKQFDEAIACYNRALQSKPDYADAHNNLGTALFAEKRFDEADRELKAILIQNPVNQELLLTIGVMYLEADRLGQAIALFSNYLKTHPEDQKVRFFLASAYEERKLSGHALDAFKMIPPDSELYGNAQINIGLILKKEGKIAEAIEVMEKAVRTNRDMPGLYVYLSSLYEDDKKLSSAERILREGLLALPNSIDLHYSLGVLYEKTNRFKHVVEKKSTNILYNSIARSVFFSFS